MKKPLFIFSVLLGIYIIRILIEWFGIPNYEELLIKMLGESNFINSFIAIFLLVLAIYLIFYKSKTIFLSKKM